MAINGHKERALMRRGLYAQETLLKQQHLNEVKRRTPEKQTDDSKKKGSQLKLPFEYDQSADIVNINYHCYKDGILKKQNSVYCKLKKELDELDPTRLYTEITPAINRIYKFFKPEKKDNRTVFLALIDVLLRNENPLEAIKTVGNFLEKETFADSQIRKALYELKKEAGKITDASDIKIINYGGKPLDKFLSDIRYAEYLKYENSFAGQNMEIVRGSSKTDVKDFYKTVLSLYEKFGDKIKTEEFLIESDDISKNIAEIIINTKIENLLYKADIKVVNDLKYKNEIIIPKNSFLEVKKMDYSIDSYYSEYLSIYKNSSIPDISKEPGFKKIYNILIDKIFKILSTSSEGKKLIGLMEDDISGIIFDNNLIVLKEDIEFYWSNKGQKNCDEHRLSVRFRIKNSQIEAYIYDSETHSPDLKLQLLALDPKSKQYCPLSF